MKEEGDIHGEEEMESKPVTFGFYPMDKHIQSRLLEACRAILRRATPEQIHDLSYLMHALQRLPLTTPGISGSVSLASRYENSAAYHGFEFCADGFILTTGESMNFGLGWDHESHNVLEVGTSAMRDDSDGDDFTEWLNIFCGQAENAATESEIFCEVDDSVDLFEHSEGLPWEQNPLLDEI